MFPAVRLGDSRAAHEMRPRRRPHFRMLWLAVADRENMFAIIGY